MGRYLTCLEKIQSELMAREVNGLNEVLSKIMTLYASKACFTGGLGQVVAYHKGTGVSMRTIMLGGQLSASS